MVEASYQQARDIASCGFLDISIENGDQSYIPTKGRTNYWRIAARGEDAHMVAQIRGPIKWNKDGSLKISKKLERERQEFLQWAAEAWEKKFGPLIKRA
jgi:hypothetical protein